MAYQRDRAFPKTFGTTRRNPYTGDAIRGEMNQYGEPMGSRDPMFPPGGGSNLDAGVFAGRAQFPGTPIARSPMAPVMRSTIQPASGLRTGSLQTGALRTGSVAPPALRPQAQFPGYQGAVASGVGRAQVASPPAPSPAFGVAAPASAFPGGLPNGANGSPSVRGVAIDPRYQTPGASPVGVISGGNVTDGGLSYNPDTGQTGAADPLRFLPQTSAAAPKAFPGPLRPLSGAVASSNRRGAGFGDLKMEEGKDAIRAVTPGAFPTPQVQFPGMAALRMEDARPPSSPVIPPHPSGPRQGFGDLRIADDNNPGQTQAGQPSIMAGAPNGSQPRAGMVPQTPSADQATPLIASLEKGAAMRMAREDEEKRKRMRFPGGLPSPALASLPY